MQPVACISLDENFLLAGEGSPHCFSSPYLLVQLKHKFSPATLSLLDWDARPRWQTSLPGVRGDGSDTLALAPAGHVLALAHRQGGQVYVWSWRDGKMLGIAHFHWPSGTACADPWVQVSNSGRVWLNANLLADAFAIPMYWWAVDGAQVCEGRYTPTCPNIDDKVYTTLSPDGTAVIICNSTGNDSGVADYATLGVRNGRVIVTHVSSTETIGNTFTWQDNQTAVDAAGRHLGAKLTASPRNGASTAGNQHAEIVYRKDQPDKRRYYVVPAPPAPSWAVPAAAQQFGAKMLCSTDGRLLLVRETRSFLRYDLQPGQHALKSRPRRESEQLALYAAPGRLCAFLPLPYLIAHDIDYTADTGQIALSPDGHRVAIVANDPDGKQALLVYAVK